MTLRLVIFDCDGVLVDSETVAGRVASAALAELGWEIDPRACQALFTGMTLRDCVPIVEGRVGPVPEDWLASVAARMLQAMQEEAAAMPGAIEMLRATDALGLPWRIASNSSRREMAAKLRVTGLAPLVGDRYHSASDVARGKPAPDLFLAAAAAHGVAPEACLVVEDSRTGVIAAQAAGMACVGYAPHGPGEALAADGAALVVRDHADLPALFLRARSMGPARLVEGTL